MTLHHRSYGSGPPLIILHGFLGSGGNWHTLASRRFGEHFEVYAVDQRNHGRSPHHDEMNYRVLAQDLVDFLDQHDLERAHVLGHSMGGKTAMQLALSNPQRVDALVVVDIAPRGYPPQHLDILEALRAVPITQVESRDEVDEALATRVSSAPVRQFLLKNLSYDSGTGSYSWQVNLDVLYEQYEEINAAVEADAPFRGPALFVRGEKSPYVTEADVNDIGRLFPPAEVATIPGAGHWVHADAPEAFADTVVEFLRSV